MTSGNFALRLDSRLLSKVQTQARQLIAAAKVNSIRAVCWWSFQMQVSRPRLWQSVNPQWSQPAAARFDSTQLSSGVLLDGDSLPKSVRICRLFGCMENGRAGAFPQQRCSAVSGATTALQSGGQQNSLPSHGTHRLVLASKRTNARNTTRNAKTKR